MGFTKIEDIKNLTSENLEIQIIQLKKEIFDLKMKQATRQAVKTHLFKHKKHQLAQLLTLQNNKFIK